MKLGELFINLGVKGSTKELDKTIEQLENAKKKLQDNQKQAERTGQKYELLKNYLNDLKNATNDNEKALIKKAFANKIEVLNAQKSIEATDEQIKGQKELKNQLTENAKKFLKIVGILGAFTAAAVGAYRAVDRMVNRLAQANSTFITFQRTTGLNLASLNKYASAASSVNLNASPEQMADTMRNLAQNLFDIRMGRGDISPYQELAFVGGKSFNPMGMGVEELIENVREAIKGVNDVQATNIITRMGFSPDDLLMLRMTKEELAEINDLFLSPREREQINAYGLQFKKMRLELQLMKDRAVLALMPAFLKLANTINKLTVVWGTFATGIFNFIQNTPGIVSVFKSIGVMLTAITIALKPITAGFLALYWVLEDIAFWYAGKKSLFGKLFGERGSEKYENSAVGKTTGAIGKAKKALDKIWSLYQQRQRGEITGEEANAQASAFLKDLLKPDENKEPARPQQYMTPINADREINQTNNTYIYTSQTGLAYSENAINEYTKALKQIEYPAF